MGSVIVYIENGNGEVPNTSLEALGAAQSVAGDLGADIVAVVLGSDVSGIADTAYAHGAGRVIGIDSGDLSDYRVELYGPALTTLVQEVAPEAVFLSATTEGRDLSAWLAAELEAGVLSDVLSLRAEDGRLVATRSVYGGKLLSDVSIPEGLQIVSLRGRAFAPAEANGGSGSIESADMPDASTATEVTGFKAKSGGVSLTDASIIVSGGRGVEGPEGFEPVRQLADTLGGALGASRAAVDAGWIPYDHQVGQTGKTVSPDLYIACGISGQIQHQAGMRTSKVIVAINKDPEAPIFSLANYGIVGDLFELVPLLDSEFQKRLS